MIRNFSKVLRKIPALKRAVASIPSYSFQTSTAFNKKLGIGEASVVLEEKNKKYLLIERYQRIRDRDFNWGRYCKSVRTY